MSVEFHLQRFSIAPASVDRTISAWVKAGDFTLQPIQLSTDYAQLFTVGLSIRGFSVSRRWSWFRQRFDVRLNVAASRDDWRGAYSFLRFALSRGFQAWSEDDEVMTVEALTDASAVKQNERQFAFDLAFLRHLVSSGDGDIDLPTGPRSVLLTAADLPEEPLTVERMDAVQQILRARAARNATARLAATIELKTGMTAIVWSGESLIAPVVDFIVLGADGFPENAVYVPWEVVMTELGDGVVRSWRTPPTYYFGSAAADSPQWRRLVSAGRPIDTLGQETRAGL